MAKAKQHLVKCKYCGKIFDANIEPFEKPSSNRYAHKSCHEEFLKTQSQEDLDKKALYDYINKLFKGQCNMAAINRNIKRYREEYNYTYSGIYKALIYFFEIKGNSIEKANGNIGIVPYVYKDAFNYYYSIWEANQKNETKKIEDYLPEEHVITIQSPHRKIKQRKLFTFLDEEEEHGE